MIALVKTGPNKVLELGAGEGNTCRALKECGKASETVGIELSPQAAAIARGKADKVLEGDVEKMEFPFPEKHFDYILCGDVLEHLVNPWDVLKRLKGVLADSGQLIASIPNVRYRGVIKRLVIDGEWRYEPAGGILDMTHLRFFTKKEIFRLFESTGYKVDAIQIIFRKKEEAFINTLTFKVFDDLLAYQYLVTVSKRPL